MRQADCYQRTVSSGMVFERKVPAKNESENVLQQRTLLCLIEEEMELSVRSHGCLNNAGIKLIGQLVQKSASELLKLKNFGRTSLHEIEENLAEMGLTLDMKLNFFPWNRDGNGAELIRILSLQEPDGSFRIDDDAAKALGIDFSKLNQRVQETAKNKDKKTILILQTKYLVELLESKFEKDIPYLTGLLKPHRIWLERASR